MDNFDKAAKLGGYLSKGYARDVFKLLNAYKDISASEAASRLRLHIQTVQEFLEGMTVLGVLQKVEATEKKRPYFRYSVKNSLLSISLDLSSLNGDTDDPDELRIKEKKNSGAKFSMARGQQYFSTVMWLGKGRQGKSTKLNLTTAQGKFLFHLPFPDAEALLVDDIMSLAGVDKSYRSEIIDIVNELLENNIISSD